MFRIPLGACISFASLNKGLCERVLHRVIVCVYVKFTTSGRGGVQLREARYGLFNMERGLRGEGTKK